MPDLVQGDEVGDLPPHRRHPDLEPALGATVAMTDPDHDRAAAAVDAPDPVEGAEVVDMAVEGSRMHDVRG